MLAGFAMSFGIQSLLDDIEAVRGHSLR